MEVQDLLSKVSKQLSVGRAFGAAYERNGTSVIPVALVAGGGGGGEGTTGTVPSDTTDGEGFVGGESEDVATSSQGSGGGLGGLVMPVGVYVVNDDQVRWVPAVNANLVIVIAFMTVRLIVRSRHKSHRHA